MNLCDNKLEKLNNTILNVMPNPRSASRLLSLSCHVKMKDEAKIKSD